MKFALLLESPHAYYNEKLPMESCISMIIFVKMDIHDLLIGTGFNDSDGTGAFT